MILFFNFAPIEYLGGAERQIYELFIELKKKESTKLMTLSEKISSIYGKVILGQIFEDRSNGKLKIVSTDYMKISLLSFIPFTKRWLSIRNEINTARLIYIKADIPELILLVYFANFSVLNKVVCGLRSPLYYPSPKKANEYLHNLVYKSFIYKILLKKSKYVHVINQRDEYFLNNTFHLKNVIHIPLHLEISSNIEPKRRDLNTLEIIFIGELLFRKGVDILKETIHKSPSNYNFHIVGKGPMEEEIKQLAKEKPNCIYHGYLQKDQLFELISECDVLYFPSRAEGFGGVILEAMQMGLKIIDSPEIRLNLPNYIEYTPDRNNSTEYQSILKKLYGMKSRRRMSRNKIRDYCIKNYSKEVIMPQIVQKLFY